MTGRLDGKAAVVVGAGQSPGETVGNGRAVAILQDLPGPKLRIGPLRDGVVELTPGEHLIFSCGGEEQAGDAHHMSLSWGGLPDAVSPPSLRGAAGCPLSGAERGCAGIAPVFPTTSRT